MTKKEKVAFAQGVEEGFVRAAELSSKPEKVLRQFRRVCPTFQRVPRVVVERVMREMLVTQ